MRGVDRERREDREDALGERVRGPRAILVGEIRGVDQADPLLVERRPELVGEEPLDAGEVAMTRLRISASCSSAASRPGSWR